MLRIHMRICFLFSRPFGQEDDVVVTMQASQLVASLTELVGPGYRDLDLTQPEQRNRDEVEFGSGGGVALEVCVEKCGCLLFVRCEWVVLARYHVCFLLGLGVVVSWELTCLAFSFGTR